ncbi:MAG: 3-oxoacyl-[acyl-carrier protein] reductase, partial [uncultured Thermomicrobiales bacterium]
GICSPPTLHRQGRYRHRRLARHRPRHRRRVGRGGGDGGRQLRPRRRRRRGGRRPDRGRGRPGVRVQGRRRTAGGGGSVGDDRLQEVRPARRAGQQRRDLPVPGAARDHRRDLGGDAPDQPLRSVRDQPGRGAGDGGGRRRRDRPRFQRLVLPRQRDPGPLLRVQGRAERDDRGLGDGPWPIKHPGQRRPPWRRPHRYQPRALGRQTPAAARAADQPRRRPGRHRRRRLLPGVRRRGLGDRGFAAGGRGGHDPAV